MIGKFILKLSILIVPYSILSLILLDEGEVNGIGGGGYDLSGLVYGSLLFALIILWLIWVLIGYLRSEMAVDKQINRGLLILGAISLLAAWFIIN
ncbi:MAG: hypothetical protein EOO85_06530 [Pedobacter sp.]|nr:MAG: hypothetical protein EOO85_06530 [Pedobacter sp.]